MVDLVVVGGGFWGIGTAILAEWSNLTVKVFDNQSVDGASRAAAGIVCRHWYTQQTIRKMLPEGWTKASLDEGVEFLTEFGLQKTGELFSSYQNQKQVMRSDCYLLPFPSSLLARVATRKVAVTALLQRPWGVLVQAGGRLIPARKVVVAAGATTDLILTASNLTPVQVRPLRGRALLVRGNIASNQPWTYMKRPYCHYTVRSWAPNTLRVGDSVEKGYEENPTRFDELQQVTRIMTSQTQSIGVLSGVRPVLPRMIVAKVAENIVVATGGHRVGLAMTAWVGRRCLKLLNLA